MNTFKGKLYAAGALLLAIVGFILGVMTSKTRTPDSYRSKVDDTKVKLHKQAANEAFKKAKSHIKKAKDISVKRERESSATEDEAIMKWNDDKL